jgi:hypothetical protein
MTAESILAIGVGVRAAAAPLVPGTGDSFTLRSQDMSKQLKLVDIITNFTVASTVLIRSARMHDNVVNIEVPCPAAAGPQSALRYVQQNCIPQDNFTVIAGIGGGAATFDNALFTFFYEDLVGAAGNLYTWDSIKQNIKNILTVPTALTPSAVGDWSTGAAINSTNDLLKANTNYAILGGYGNALSACIGISGPCTGNLKIAWPTRDEEHHLGSCYLADMSVRTGLPFIPVMKSADKGGTFCFTADPAAAITVGYFLLAELGS